MNISEFTKSSAFSPGPNILHGCRGPKQSRRGNLRSPHLLVTLAVTLFWSTQHSLSAEHHWYECPVGQTKHVDLNKISLIRESVIGPNLHTLQFYSFGSHFLLGVSASGFSDQMLAQLESLLLPKSFYKPTSTAGKLKSTIATKRVSLEWVRHRSGPI